MNDGGECKWDKQQVKMFVKTAREDAGAAWNLGVPMARLFVDRQVLRVAMMQHTPVSGDDIAALRAAMYKAARLVEED